VLTLGVLAPVVLAPFVGSYLGVLIRRLPRGLPTAFARSRCESCGSVLAARDLVPLGSYLALRGRCRACRAPIAPFHWGIELAAVGVPLGAALAGDDGARLWAGCLLGWTLLVLVWIDWEHLRLPDALTLPLLLAGLAVTAWLTPDALTAHAAAAALGWLALLGLGVLYRRLRGRDGLGEGDAKLLGAAGAWVGPAGLPSIVLLAAVIGLAVALIAWLAKRNVSSATAIPFGPCLAAALWADWLHGSPLLGVAASCCLSFSGGFP